jgi:hypothetical protein
MIAFRGRLGFRQYLPTKPTKYGIKVKIRADSENGYYNEFEIYTGKSGLRTYRVVSPSLALTWSPDFPV